MPDKVRKIIVIITIIVGLGLVSYPFISSFVNSFRQEDIIEEYSTVINNLNSADVEKAYQSAQDYNEKLKCVINRFEHTDEYDKTPGISADGMIGYLDIRKIDVHLPIYHSTSDKTLSEALGHMEGTSFPVEGKGVHAVVVGHSGMMQQDMFTDLPQLKIGDTFSITVANRTIIYEVDNIETVLPNEVSSLRIYPNENYCTLVTCVPYGVNSHRLLVRGRQIDSQDNSTEENTVKSSHVVTRTDMINYGSLIGGLIVITVPASIVLIQRKREYARKREKENERNK